MSAAHKRLDEKKDDAERWIGEYEKQVAGMPNLSGIVSPTYLTMTMQELRGLSVEELGEAVVAMNAYALRLQKTINREKAWVVWGESQLEQIAAHILPKIDPRFGWNERMLIAKNDHPACRVLQDFLAKVRMKIADLEYVPNEIHRFADAVNNLRFTKSRQGKE